MWQWAGCYPHQTRDKPGSYWNVDMGLWPTFQDEWRNVNPGWSIGKRLRCSRYLKATGPLDRHATQKLECFCSQPGKVSKHGGGPVVWSPYRAQRRAESYQDPPPGERHGAMFHKVPESWSEFCWIFSENNIKKKNPKQTVCYFHKYNGLWKWQNLTRQNDAP